MPTIVDLPEKGVSLEFPDNMSPVEMEAAILRNFPDQGYQGPTAQAALPGPGEQQDFEPPGEGLAPGTFTPTQLELAARPKIKGPRDQATNIRVRAEEFGARPEFPDFGPEIAPKPVDIQTQEPWPEIPSVTSQELQAELGMGKLSSQVAAGLDQAVAGVANFLISPWGIATLGTGSMVGGTGGAMINSAFGKAFVADMARSAPGQVMEAYNAFKRGDVETGTRELAGAAFATYLVGKEGAHAIKGPKAVLDKAFEQFQQRASAEATPEQQAAIDARAREMLNPRRSQFEATGIPRPDLPFEGALTPETEATLRAANKPAPGEAPEQASQSETPVAPPVSSATAGAEAATSVPGPAISQTKPTAEVKQLGQGEVTQPTPPTKESEAELKAQLNEELGQTQEAPTEPKEVQNAREVVREFERQRLREINDSELMQRARAGESLSAAEQARVDELESMGDDEGAAITAGLDQEAYDKAVQILKAWDTKQTGGVKAPEPPTPEPPAPEPKTPEPEAKPEAQKPFHKQNIRGQSGIVKEWILKRREIQDKAPVGQKESWWARDFDETFAPLYQNRPFKDTLEEFAARYKEDFDGEQLAKDFTPEQLEQIKTLLLKQDNLWPKELMSQSPPLRSALSATMGRVIEAQKRQAKAAEPKAPEPETPAESLQQARTALGSKIGELKRQLAGEQKKLDKLLNKKGGAWVPPPITHELAGKISTRMAKIQDKIDDLEAQYKKLTEEPAKEPESPEPQATTPPKAAATLNAGNVETEANVEVARDKTASPNAKFKAQKSFLLDAIDQAIEQAPEGEARPHGQTPELEADFALYNKYAAEPSRFSFGHTDADLKAYEDAMADYRKNAAAELEPLFQKYGVPKKTKGSTPYLNVEGKTIQSVPPQVYSTATRVSLLKEAMDEANRKAVPKVEIEIPGDGTYLINNTKANLREFRQKAQKQFPGAAPRGTKPSQAKTTANPIPAVKQSPSLEDQAKVLETHVSTDETRQIINKGYANGQEMVATDGRRLIRIVGKTKGSQEKPMLIENGKFREFKEDEPKFPNYTQVIPEKGMFIGTADTGDLWQWVKQASFMTGEKSNSVHLWKNPDGTFGVSSRTPELGEAAHNVKKGARYVASYNPNYLMDALAAIRRLGSERVDLFVDKDHALSPIHIKGKNAEVVLMPMRATDSRTAIIDPETAPAGVAIKEVPYIDERGKERTDMEKVKVVEGVKEAHGRPEHGSLPPPVAPLEPEAKEEPKAKAKGKRKHKAGAEEYRAGESRSKAGFDPFSAEDGDLEDFFNSRFGEVGGGTGELSFGRGGQFRFPSYEAFRDWMMDRYKERDLEGMKLAFAEADTPAKVRFVKENRAAADHLKAWIAHIATGAPLPATDPPITRTTPRPMPGAPAGGQQPGPGPGPTGPAPGGARPGSPPPPPRPSPNIPHHRQFGITALVQLMRQIGKFPTMNEKLRRALGRMVWDQQAGTGEVELKQRLFWDPKLANEVLGHEIGHYIDLIIPLLGKGKNFGQKLKPLYDFRGKMWEAKDLRDEARTLSRQWRGPFLNGDPYRDSSKELFADFMSAMFANPEWVNQNFGKLFDAFADLRAGKPQFASAYREIETWLQGGTMARELIEQDRKAVERTIDILEASGKRSGANLWDRMKFATLTLWDRAYKAEGRPTKLGTSVAEELEYSRAWAAKENSLFADDVKKQVDPLLARVDPDTLQARTYLLSYAKAWRTIHEIRAAGQWLKVHPDEARTILETITDRNFDPSLHSKWGQAVANAADHELYDLTAAILRDVWDRGDSFANKIRAKIDGLNLGADGQGTMMAFNVRGKLLDPQGLTPETARGVLRELKDRLGPDKFADLEQAAGNLRNLFYEVTSKMHDEGLIADSTWKELIEPNRGSYVPYAVLDYFDGYIKAGVLKQKGTAKDVADITVATELKVASSNMWRQTQRQVQLLRDAYQKGGLQIPVGEALKKASDIDNVRRQHLDDDTSREVLWVDGKPHVVEFPNDPGKLIEKAMNNPAFYEHMQWIMEAANMTHRLMQFYTQFHVPFMFWRNPLRGLRTGILKVGFGKTLEQAFNLENYRLAKNYAEAAFGGEMLPEVRELVDNQVLMPPRLSASIVRDSEQLRQLMENHGVLAFQIRHLKGREAPWWERSEGLQKFWHKTEQLFASYEAFEKIYNYRAAQEGGATMEEARAIARRGGIPNPGVGGKWSLAMEVFLPWTRVHMQGIRATWDMLRDPDRGRAFAGRFLLTEGLPRMMKAAIGTGVAAGTINWLLRKDEDPKKSVMAEFFRRVSPYKMALDDIVPLFFYDPRTGKIHHLMEYAGQGDAVPKHWEAVSLRLPASEEGKLWGVLLYNLLTSAGKGQESLGRPGQNPALAMGTWVGDYLIPGFSPILTTGSTLYDLIGRGQNPNESYTGQPAANQKLFEAGGMARAEAIAGYTLNQMGSVGEVAGVLASNFGLLDERALKTMSQRLPTDYRQFVERLPFIKTAIAHDNYGQYREEKTAQLAEDQLRARAKLLMGPEVRAMYDFYYKNYDRQAKLTRSEKLQFNIAESFVHQIWGDSKDTGPTSAPRGVFYRQAIKASGSDGSRMLRQTLTRDLNMAAAQHLAAFEAERKSEGK